MPLVQRILLAIRTLTEDEPHNYPRRKHNRAQNRQANNSRRKQAVGLVITFRDLFASGGLNFILDDVEANTRSSRKEKSNRTSKNSSMVISSQTSQRDKRDQSESESKLSDGNKKFPANFDFSPLCSSQDVLEENIPLLPDDQVITSSEIALRSSSQLGPMPVSLLTSTPMSGKMGVFGRRRLKHNCPNLTVSLTPDDENKTVATLRKVLKWSPSKQNMAKFTVPIPNQEKHTAVAAVQNAVNRVKEEQEQKRKRKFRLFKITFC